MAAVPNLNSRRPDAVEGMGLCFKWAELQAEPRFCVASFSLHHPVEIPIQLKL